MTTPADLQAPVSTSPAATTTSTWEDLVDIFYAPSSVFERRRLGRYGLALLVLALGTTALYFASRGIMDAVMDAEMQRQSAKMLADNPNMTEEQLAMGRSMGEKIAKFTPVFLPIGVAISCFLIGLATWVVGKIVGAKQTFAAAVMITVFSMFPRLIESVVIAIMGLVTGAEGITSRYSVGLGLARFLDPATSGEIGLKMASMINPFVLWGAFLLALGMRITGNLTWQKAAIVAVVVTLLRAVLTGY